ncbi:MAG: class I tRNA ligase family protein, partial [Candidatus Nomurabacteria bacterium]|nr:class I tRNA ligase family protein [Candidatus Nomurabacteria bacterium]
MSNDNQHQKSNTAIAEEKILQFWRDNDIFKKTLEQDSPHGEFVFYDGPPYATGEPHYGHLLGGTLKDVIPRYKTMQGYHVARRWGWDCHGLPIENLIEKELDLKSKKDIEDFGVDKFNSAARDSVLRYEQTWKEIIPRTGRWVDMENPYMTMTPNYMESVWWVFSQLHKKNLVNKGFKVMHLCPRCETTLSNFEVNQGYADVKDITATAKFKVIGQDNTYFLAWTTTPWTLPGNVTLAVGEDIDYVYVRENTPQSPDVDSSPTPGEQDALYIVAKKLVEKVFTDKEYEIIKTVSGSELVGTKYEPIFDYYSKNEKLENRENGWRVYSADFVTTDSGTGIVHIAPAFGSDDAEMG